MTAADRWILAFGDDESTRQDSLGGKGAQLAALTRAGFPVPSGFVVTTDAYRDLVSDGPITGEIAPILGEIAYDDPELLELQTARIRKAVASADLTDGFVERVSAAYGELGDDVFVAVRSSGTAEDLADTSFAGMHDTYLDIRGLEDLLDAIKRCWASMFTSRATAYRGHNGFDQLEVKIAVVVQTMVASEASGVIFTANPMTTATDETVINSSWGLGEATVSGLVTPDEFVVTSRNCRIRKRHIPAKAMRIVRAASGSGVVHEDVPLFDRERPSLTDGQVATLTRLGQRVAAHYGDMPQDIEWGFAEDQFYLLQSRPVTGAELSWDAEVNDEVHTTAEDRTVVWTRSFADEVWSGAITPLMFSIRGLHWERSWSRMCAQLDLPDAANMWMWKYHKAEAYYNSSQHRIIVERACPPAFRAGLVDKLPPAERDDALAAPFSWFSYARKYVKGQFLNPEHRLDRWLHDFDDFIENRADHLGDIASVEDLREFTDRELDSYIDSTVELEYEQYTFLFPFFLYGRDAVSLLSKVVTDWYDGEHQFAAADLMTGLPRRTKSMIEAHELWEMAQLVYDSPRLREVFDRNEGAAFFEAIENDPAAAPFSAAYRDFAARYAHRGHGDRDFVQPRRSEDPALDYRSIAVLMGTPDPAIREAEVNKQREAVLDDVLANVRRKPLGAIRAEIIKVASAHALKFLVLRDNERFCADRDTMNIKLALLELNRRLMERGLLREEREFYFLTRGELSQLLRGHVEAGDPLLRAKIEGRRRDFDRFNSKEITPPAYLFEDRAVDVTQLTGELPDGVFQGLGTSRGTVTGTAKLVSCLSEIGRVTKGDILVCNSTDPGWTPVFHVAAGIVGETGGMLAHFSCLSREFGMPAMQLQGALKLIPDGALVTINGDTGQVTLENDTTAEPTDNKSSGTGESDTDSTAPEFVTTA